MLILPNFKTLIDETKLEVDKETSYIAGAQLLQASSSLDLDSKTEIAEAINYANSRLILFNHLVAGFQNLQLISDALAELDFPNRASQFASQEVIDDLKKLLTEASKVVDDFKVPVEIEIVSTDISTN